MLNLALYGIQVSSKMYIVLAALLVIAGLFIIIKPQAFLRWGRRIILMAVVAYFSTQQG